MIINYIDLVLIIICALTIFISTRRGILISLISMLRVFVGAPFALHVSGKYNELVYDNFIKQAVIDSIKDKMSEKGGLDELLSRINETVSSIAQNIDLSAVSKLNSNKAAEYIEQNIFRPIALVAVQIALFLVIFIVILIVTGLIIHLLKLRNKKDGKDKPPLRRTDMLLGGAFGLLKSAVIVAAISAVSALIIDIVPKDYAANAFINQLQGSRIIAFVSQFVKI